VKGRGLQLQTDHDLGQRTNPAALHDAFGALLARIDAASVIER
jgi:hypothetical protein